jgi:hypothetical protein
MKQKTIHFLIFMIFAYPVLIKAQDVTEFEQSKQKSNQTITNGSKGTFNIALQDFSFGATMGMFTFTSLSLRAGYSISNKDMVFLSGRFTSNPRVDYSKAIETSLFYRRYFLDGNFQPFLQFGAGLGYTELVEKEYYRDDSWIYGTMSMGTGVSFRYKRWGFELGLQTDYNRYSTGRLSIGPIVGVSFSF